MFQHVKDQTTSAFTGQTQAPVFKPTEPLARIDHKWNARDYLGAFLARTTSRRNSYTVAPGLYAFGQPDENSDVLVTANYKLTFDKLRRELKGRKFWILVLDTKGINVWCAAGKGTFGTAELVHKIQSSGLFSLVKHRRVIVPQLGGVGVAAHEVKSKTGFRVSYGPVEARDLPEYFDNNRQVSPAMRQIRFNWRDRLVLTPMEIIPSFKHFWKYALAIALVFGVQQEGILFQNIIQDGGPYFIAGVTAILSGALITPFFLPLLPFRSFAAKGFLAGALLTGGLFYLSTIFPRSFLGEFIFHKDPWFLGFVAIFIPAASSFLALQFTGSSTFTNMSGVYKEHKYALPLYLGAATLSIILLVVHKVSLWYNTGGLS